MSSSTNTLGKYQIIREIGRSNDVVYEAIDPSINRRVALKELWIAPNLQGAQKRERIERFRREGKAAGRLSHPNIVTIYEVGQECDRYFIAMEFLEGQTLRDVLMSGGPLPIKTATDYLLQLCSALAYAHMNGVIHRDIKPENVQILPGGLVKLTDFGIARLMEEPSITQDGQVFGTPSYMSPEQVAGKDLDARSDIFSLGVMFYEMVAGHKPFSGDSVVTITYNIMHMEAPPPPGAPPWVGGIIRKAMAKERDMRYSSVEEFAEDLREQKSSDQFLAGPTSTGAWPSPFGGGASQDPLPQQQPQGPLTPYGTPMPSQQAGSAPDPFAQHPGPILQPMPPPAPPAPMMSAETRNFLGVFLFIIALAGMLVFAVWAINKAYTSYLLNQTTMVAERYYKQGLERYNEGKIDDAITEWKIAIDRAPDSPVASKAREGIYNAEITTAYSMYQQRNGSGLMAVAQDMIDLKEDGPEGHYYMGVAHELQGQVQKAVEEYQLAEHYGGNDQYAQSAREKLRLLNPQGSGSTEPEQPAQPSPTPSDSSGIPYTPSEQGQQ